MIHGSVISRICLLQDYFPFSYHKQPKKRGKHRQRQAIIKDMRTNILTLQINKIYVHFFIDTKYPGEHQNLPLTVLLCQNNLIMFPIMQTKSVEKLQLKGIFFNLYFQKTSNINTVVVDSLQSHLCLRKIGLTQVPMMI